MRRISIVAALVVCLSMALVGVSQASITGTPIGDPSFPGWSPNSTNALNFAKQVPGREGQDAPYVLFNSAAPGSVTLDFFNPGPGLAFFETRIDGVSTGSTLHPIVVGDTIHTGGTAVPSGTSVLGKSFAATSTVDIRLALGGERDWDFNWTRFDVPPVPEPATILVWSGISVMAGLAYLRKRRNS